MELILLEKVTNLGDPGDLVNVKSGYARNFLVPSGKAIYANEENKLEYEKRKKELNKAEEERISKAKEIAEKTVKIKIDIPVTVSEEGTLYGSVGTREIAEAILKEGVEIDYLPKGRFTVVDDLKDLDDNATADVGDIVSTKYDIKPSDNFLGVNVYELYNEDKDTKVVVSEDNIERIRL